MGDLAAEDRYAPTDEEIDRYTRLPMPRVPVMGALAAPERDVLQPAPRNPFAPPEAVDAAVRGGIKVADYYLGAPSRAVRGPDIGRYPEGSEEAEFLRQLHGKQEQDWAQSTALGLVADPIALWGVKPGIPGTTLGAQATRSRIGRRR
jgi:hypothetical protein